MFGLTDKIISYISGAVALVLLATCLWLRADLALTRHQRDSAQKEASATHTKLDESEGERRTMLSHVQMQNDAVDLMQQRAANNKLKVNHLLALWEDGNKAKRARIDAIQNRIATSKETSCVAAIKEIRGMLQ